MTSSILISVSALVFSIWFGGAFLHQGYRAANRSLIIIGLAFLLFVIPFLMDLFFNRSGLYMFFVWPGILLALTQLKEYFQFQAEKRIKLIDILLLKRLN